MGEDSARASILIVEDDQDIGDNLDEILRDEGYECWLARSADEALTFLEHASAPPRLILLDWVMPGIPAPTFVARLRTSPVWAAIPVVLVTASTSIPQELAVQRVLTKPFNVWDLIACVRGLASLDANDAHPAPPS